MATIPPPTTTEYKFIGLLRELFQLDQADLDFGIYRILRQRQTDVEQFLTKELPKHLTEARQQMATQGLDDVRKRRDNAQQRLSKDYKLDFSSPEALAERVEKLRGAELPDFEALYQEYEASQKLLDAAYLAEELERDAYNDLFRFFARYYDSGDFITQPRSGDAAYLLPYNGEEVKLYWANHDQYYIKTGENFRHYRFQQGRPDDLADEARLTVDLELLDAETTAGNNKDKKGRLYLPVPEQPDGTSYFLYDADARHLRLRFRYGVPLDEEKSRWGDKQTKQSGDGGINERVLRDVEARIKAGNEHPLQLLLKENNHQRGSGKNATAVNALTYHLHRFTVPNQFDYFIHRNLGRFLRQELDYYLKHELLALDFLSPDWRREDAERAVRQQLTRAGVVRAVAMRLIDFLHELEEYQRLLFEKKKLVARSSYCLTLDRIPSEVRPTVLRYVLNEDGERKQLKAWKKLGMLPTDDYAPAIEWLEAASRETSKSAEAEPSFDKNHPYARLVLDTEHLTEELTDALIHHIDNLDEQTGGVLINSENWQALNALQQRYSDQVRCITIDPPYNRLTDSFPYKDNFKHSSWLTMMYDRLKAARTLLRKDGALFSNIDENERQNLQEVLNMTFGSENRIEELIWSQNTTHSQSPLYSTNHEYVMVYARNKATAESISSMFREPKPGFIEMMDLVADLNPKYPSIAEIQEAIADLFSQHIEEFKIELRELGLEYNKDTKKTDPWLGLYNYSAAEYRDENGKLVSEEEAETLKASIWIWRESDTSAPARKQSDTTRDPDDPNYRYYRPLHPKSGKPCPHPKSGWRFPYSWPDNSRESFEELDKDHRIVWGEPGVKLKVPQYKRFLHEVETNVAKSVFHDYTDGEKQLAALFGEVGLFPTPKPTTLPGRFIAQTCTSQDTVLDFFAGSGTTAHATLNLNRKDNGNRRYILVEMGEYFDTVTKPRVLKSVYSDIWQDGRADAPSGGVSHLAQVMQLEQYEDTLNNMTFAEEWDEASKQADFTVTEQFSYALRRSATGSMPTLGMADAFRRPFAYRMRIIRQNEPRDTNVDLVSSFSLLLGLRVRRRRTYRPDQEVGVAPLYVVVDGYDAQRRPHLVIWRDEPSSADALATERDWLQAQPWYKEAIGTHAVVYTNANNTFGAKAIEPDFHRLLTPTA